MKGFETIYYPLITKSFLIRSSITKQHREKIMAETPYIGIDLFAGVGGLSYGLSAAGFDMRLGIESDPNASFNLKKNNKNIEILTIDIHKVDPSQIMKLECFQDQGIDIIVGGPPCQGFSQSNRRTHQIANPSNNLYKEYFKFIRTIKPEVFFLENVEGLMTLNKGEIFNDILHIGTKLGYNLQWNVVNSENFGVPQRRKRIIIIGTKNTTSISFLNINVNKIITVREAIDDLPLIENGNEKDILNYSKSSQLSNYQNKMRINASNSVSNNLTSRNGDLIIERYKFIPQGGNWKDIPSYLFFNYKNPQNCHGSIYYRLKWDEPSVVLSNFRKNMLIHPEYHRGLSVREAARLQSFPDSYIFYGRLDYQQQLVANAVPPLLAEGIGRKISFYLKESIKK